MVVFALMFFSFVSAVCNLDVSLINQDPYPAIPGDYVKLIFQVDGVSQSECGEVSVQLLEEYPLIFDPNMNAVVRTTSGIYAKDYGAFLLAPYKVRVDEDALNGANPIEVKLTSNVNKDGVLYQFDLEVQDARADFEVYVNDYDYATNVLTLEILNIAESDVEAVAIEIPKQENILVKGSSNNIVGDVDSNEYTTADFEAIPQDGEIKVNIGYSDSTNTRRVVEKVVEFDSNYFTDRIADKKQVSVWSYVVWILIIGGVVYYFYRKRKKRLEMLKHKRH